MKPRQHSVLREKLHTAGFVLLVGALLMYPLDWAVWRVRMLAGAGMGEVPISETTAATLKGNRFEVYSQQSTTVTCSRSLLPQAGAGACWWLRTHPQIVTQY